MENSLNKRKAVSNKTSVHSINKETRFIFTL